MLNFPQLEFDSEAARRLAIAMRAADLGIWDWDLLSNTMIYSERAKAICGFPPGQPVTFEMVRNVTHPEDLPRTMALARRALDPNERAGDIFRYRIIKADTGELRWVLAHGEAQFGEVDGALRALRFIGTLQDITAQVAAEEALRASEARLRLAMEAGRMAVWEVDLVTDTLLPSPELNVLCGFPADATPTLEEFRGRYAPGERERLRREGMEAIRRGETSIQNEYRQIWPDGSEHWLLLRAQLIGEPPDKWTRAIGVVFDITERRRSEERRTLLIHELNHRVKNTLAGVQSIVTQSLRDLDLPEGRRAALDARLNALARAHDLLTQESWEGAGMRQLAEEALAPFQDAAEGRFAVSGPDLRLTPKAALAIAMALHELAVNAVKHGALSRPDGRVDLGWGLDERSGALFVRFVWRESGGPPPRSAPPRRGFGSRLIERTFAGELAGAFTLSHPSEGLCLRAEIPVDEMLARRG